MRTLEQVNRSILLFFFASSRIKNINAPSARFKFPNLDQAEGAFMLFIFEEAKETILILDFSQEIACVL